jgi:3-oxoacyl-[acyl-carrier-protein] synthase-3
LSLFSVKNIAVKGISACVPKNSESNYDYDWISEKERELLIKTTGVKTRRVAPHHLATSDYCYEAAKKLIGDLNWNPKEIELLIFVSQSRDYILPSTSVILQDRLLLPKTCLAFDVPLGCSGYVYGLSILANMMNGTNIKKALLLVGDISTRTCSYKDKSCYPLFGDAGTATALEYTKDAKMDFNLQSDGSGHKAIMIEDVGFRNFISEDSFNEQKIEEGIYRNRMQLALNGIEVFNFSLREVALNINTLLAFNNTNVQHYNYAVFHQANLLIIDSIRKKLKLEKEKVPVNIDRFGNTSSASIPLAIVTELKEEVKNKSLQLLLCGFGVGLSWGTVALDTNCICIPSLIEI